MATSNPAEDYLDEWQHLEEIEDTNYQTPPESTPKRNIGGFKAQLEDLNSKRYQGIGSPLGYTTESHGCVLWPVGEPGLKILVNGKLKLKESGSFIIIGAAKSRFGHWTLVVNRELKNDDDGVG